jgi:TRAP-type C4-dicarboxylate transport system permease small subunit
MRDRSLAIILTVIAIILFGCPGLTVFCLGITGFIVFYSSGYQSYNVSPGWVNALGTLGICLGIFLIVITIIAAFFLLRRKADIPHSVPHEPLPPTKPDEPIPPSI